MALARLYCVFVLLLYSKRSCGQQVGTNNQNIGANNAIGLHQSNQQSFQRTSNNINQIPNGPNTALNNNLGQFNSQAANSQQSSNLPGPKQGNLQQPYNLPPNLQSQSVNNLQITKIGFSPVPPVVNNPSTPSMQFQNAGITNGQLMQTQLQNIPGTNSAVSQIANGPISTLTLGDLVGLKGQSLMSLFNSQNNDQQNQQHVVSNTISTNQLTDMQKQFLLRSFQPNDGGLNQQGLNVMQMQPRAVSLDNQQPVTVHALPPSQQAQAIVTPLGNQPAFITVQAKPLSEYLQQQAAGSGTEDPIISLILSEFSPQYSISAAYPSLRKGSKMNLKSLVPLIISLLKEKKCKCSNCKCHNNTCKDNDCTDTSIESEIAEIFGGYSKQRTYGAVAQDSPATDIKKTYDAKPKINNKQKNFMKKKVIPVDTEELSDEDDSEYIDDE